LKKDGKGSGKGNGIGKGKGDSSKQYAKPNEETVPNAKMTTANGT
jgi:hypothetical protein